MTENIRVYLLDDHPLVLEGLQNRLNAEPGIEVLHTFTDPREFISQAEQLCPDVAVIDISLPHMDGFQLARKLKEQYGNTLKIILLSGYSYEEFYMKAYKIGVHAYLSKQASYSQIINAIKQSMLGHILIPESIGTAHSSQDALTAAERQVLQLLAKEKTNKEIAHELALSQRTVEYHLASVNQKLGVSTRIGAIVKGFELGLLTFLKED
ncbi:response regulator [Paenibacillus jilunlii]|uniref:LuxR family transcriptional regulator n=1 Tax=Paenibacillus jilunlii TaxID=682956 RepID=A0A1G9NKR8_9BACL|nr:response regulator transcription factor [Paenibacillus jilunlii]KWX77113.1 LuxR family transcriptional regulator [Paenibacillus jilunlii]SDL86941.1 two component transcriptional regulator, LuxR family [Paenibacillus jilunlii]